MSHVGEKQTSFSDLGRPMKLGGSARRASYRIASKDTADSREGTAS